ncbi:B3 domain-containing protein [Thalictrum thalictroides]|uniref:B3 domain-containing protein n=1 Tax=Thalictrum thalictroides TaxID=46969 RepID=A0A7J6V769_THATH|nr:B3 domain-containing protein [Thalictrum thalictroides]
MMKEEEILENNHRKSMGITKFKLFGVEIIGFKLMGVETYTVTKQVNEIKKETEEMNEKKKKPRTLIKDYFSEIGINHRRSFFTIRKILTKSDVGHLTRLMLSKKMANDHIKPYLTEEQNREIESGHGTEILIMDLDIKPCYRLILKKSLRADSYIIKSNWNKSFVKRRNLKEGDEIGMFWDPSEYCFAFSVLQRRQQPA